MQKLVIVVIIIFLFSSCSNYFKAVTTPVSISNIQSLNNNKKYLILRSGDKAFTMNNISLIDQNTIHCTLENIPEDHALYITKKKRLTYKAASGEYDQRTVLNEVHIYSANIAATLGNYNMSIGSVQKIEILEKDKTKTRRSHAKGFVITTAAVVVIAALAIGSSLSNMKF